MEEVDVQIMCPDCGGYSIWGHNSNRCSVCDLPLHAEIVDGKIVVSNPPELTTRHILPPQGHEQPCVICGQPCDALAGNPGKWPVGFCHVKSYGVLSWHHSACVARELYLAKQVRNLVGNNVTKTDI